MADEIARARRTHFGLVDSSVIRDHSIGINATAVYALLATYVSAQGERSAYPSRETMATALDCSTDTIDRALKVLRSSGVLVTHRRQRKTAIHYLHDMGADRAVGGQIPDSANTGSQVLDSANSALLTPQIAVLDSAVSGGSITRGVTPVSNPSLRSGAPAVADAPGLLPIEGLQNDAEDTTKAVPEDVASAIVNDWWESFNPRPTAPYIGQRQIIARLLKAGWEPQQIRGVLRGVTPPLTLAIMERRLRHPSSGAAIAPAHDWKPGETWGTR